MPYDGFDNEWRKPRPGDSFTLMWKPLSEGNPLLRGRKVRSVRGLKKPGGWMPCEVPEYMNLDGLVSRHHFILVSCPYTFCGKIFVAHRESMNPSRHSLVCPHCGRHIWFWVEGKHEIKKDDPFERVENPKKRGRSEKEVQPADRQPTPNQR